LCSLLYAQADAFVAAFDYDYDVEKEMEEGQKSFKILQKIQLQALAFSPVDGKLKTPIAIHKSKFFDANSTPPPPPPPPSTPTPTPIQNSSTISGPILLRTS
jgi:hypothetical protein